MGNGRQKDRILDDIHSRIRRLMILVLISVIVNVVMLFFFYGLSILAFFDNEFTKNLLLFFTDKIPLVTVVTVCSMIISVLYYVAIADLGRYEFGFLVTAILGFICFYSSELSMSPSDAGEIKSFLLKSCVFGMFLSILFYCYYCEAMKRLMKNVLKRSSECWRELKKSAYVAAGIYAVIVIGLLTIVKVLGEVEKIDSDDYSYKNLFDTYSRYNKAVERRNETVIMLALIAMGLILLVKTVLKVYEYICLSHSLPEEYEDYFSESISESKTN